MVRLRIGATNTGDGVFALSAIKKGELVTEMSGKLMTDQEVDGAIDVGIIRADDPFQIAEDRFIKLDRVPYLFNHSCDPNAGIRKTNELCALRDIQIGEEITYDYSTTVCTHSSWSMKCLCGSAICRKLIKNVRSIPKKRRDEYRKMRALPAFTSKEVT